MARSLNEIQTQIIDELNSPSNPALAAINFTSQVGLLPTIVWVVAMAIWIHEKLWDNYKVELEAIALAAEAGTLPWYQAQCLKFQNGYSLSWNGSKFVYSTVDESAKIVKLAAALESSGFVYIKAAKLVSGLPAPLSSPELAAFESYLNQVKFAGTSLLVTSSNADDLLLDYIIYYNPQIGLSNTFDNVEAAIKAYLTGLTFDGKFSIIALEDAIQSAIGVVNFQRNTVEARAGVAAFAPVVVTYTSESGYMALDASSPILNTANYFPA